MEHFPQQPVVPSNEHISFQEKMKQEIAQKIEIAMTHPLSEERMESLDNELRTIKSRFVKEKVKDELTKKRENEIEKEILQSSVYVKTIVEFREVLMQLGDRFGHAHNWIGKFLAHENAHANVSEQTGHDEGGYAVIFIKDDTGSLSHIQPLYISRPSASWGPQEMLLKEIEVLRAPEVYGDKLSESDKQDIESSEELLKIK